MAQVAKRRFPPAPGLLGWLGLGSFIAAVLMEFAAMALLVWLALSRNLALILPFVAAVVATVGLVATALLAFRGAWRRHPVARPAGSSMTSDQRRKVLRSLGLTTATDLIGLGVFLYLAFSLRGSLTHRMMLAAAPVVLASLVSYLGLTWRNRVLNRPPVTVLGLDPRNETIVFSIVCLLMIALFLYTGLFLIRT